MSGSKASDFDTYGLLRATHSHHHNLIRHIPSDCKTGTFDINNNVAIDLGYYCYLAAGYKTKILKKFSGFFFAANLADCIDFAFFYHTLI